MLFVEFVCALFENDWVYQKSFDIFLQAWSENLTNRLGVRIIMFFGKLRLDAKGSEENIFLFLALTVQKLLTET